MYSSTFFAAALALCLLFVEGHPTTPEAVGAVQLRLRGGGMLSSLGDALGWKREAVGSNELGCGPLPQVKAIDRSMCCRVSVVTQNKFARAVCAGRSQQ